MSDIALAPEKVIVEKSIPYSPYYDELVLVDGNHTIKVERWRIEFYKDVIDGVLSTMERYGGNYAETIIGMLQLPVFWTYFSQDDRRRIENELIDKFDFPAFVRNLTGLSLKPAFFIYDTTNHDGNYQFYRFEIGKDGLLATMRRVFEFMDNRDRQDSLELDSESSAPTVTETDATDLKTTVEQLSRQLELCKQKLLELGLSSQDYEEVIGNSTNNLSLLIEDKNHIYVQNSQDDSKMEIRMTPLDKAVYFLFLRHPEGINFSFLPDYRDEFLQIYRTLMNCRTSREMEQSAMAVTDPLSNSINEKCARIRRAFTSALGKYKAEQFCICGQRGEKKRIPWCACQK